MVVKPKVIGPSGAAAQKDASAVNSFGGGRRLGSVGGSMEDVSTRLRRLSGGGVMGIFRYGSRPRSNHVGESSLNQRSSSFHEEGKRKSQPI